MLSVQVLIFQNPKFIKGLSFPWDWLFFSLSLVLFVRITLYCNTHTESGKIMDISFPFSLTVSQPLLGAVLLLHSTFYHVHTHTCKLRVDSSSLIPPERKWMPGTAGGTQRIIVRTVKRATSWGVATGASNPGKIMFGLSKMASNMTSYSLSMRNTCEYTRSDLQTVLKYENLRISRSSHPGNNMFSIQCTLHLTLNFSSLLQRARELSWCLHDPIRSHNMAYLT